MLAQEVRANNLAHANTVGFKSLMEHSDSMPIEGSGFKSSVTTRTNSASTNFAQGAEVHTGRDLDVHITGRGFFSIAGHEGEPEELYSRAGNFRLSNEGMLLLGERQVLGEDGPVEVPDFQSINIANDGAISITPPGGGAEMQIGTLKLVNPEYAEMTLHPSGLFVHKQGTMLEFAPDVAVRSGYLEGSNVSSLDELVSMMSLSRQYEMQVKAMASASEIEKMGNQLLRA